MALALCRSRPVHDPPGHLGKPEDGQEPETAWRDQVTDAEYNARPERPLISSEISSACAPMNAPIFAVAAMA